MEHDVRKSVWDAAEACRLIQEYTFGQTLESYCTDNMRRLAIERAFEILGEALKRADDEDASFRDHIPETGSVIGMRNRIAHGYDAVSFETVWNTIMKDIPVLQPKLQAWLDANG